VATRYSVECWMVNPSGEVLLLHAATSTEFLNGFWQPLTEGIEDGESAPQAAVREIREETGLTVDPSHFLFVDDDIRVPVSEDLTVSKSLFTVRIPNAPIVASADEHDGARFFPSWEVEQRLSYASNRMTWGRVRPMLE